MSDVHLHAPSRCYGSVFAGCELVVPGANEPTVSKCGDRRVRRLLYEAASVMLTRCRQPLKLKAWALAIAKRSTMRKARIALARRLTEISSGLKGLTKEVGIPVLGLSQLNREVEKRQDKRPQLADLRESGSIEQDADVVLGLYREAYYLEHKADRSEAETDRLARCQNLLEVEILKQRSGPTIRIECFADIACNVLAEAVP